MEVAVQTMLFLELSDDQTVSEDAAVAMMDQIAATLQRLEPAEKERFRDYVRARAVRATTEAERRALESLASDLGLAGE